MIGYNDKEGYGGNFDDGDEYLWCPPQSELLECCRKIKCDERVQANRLCLVPSSTPQSLTITTRHHYHPLLPIKASQRVQHLCDVCSRQGSCAFYCDPCDFDICMPCFELDEKKMIKSMFHKDPLQIVKQDRGPFASCDVCGTNIA